MVTFSAYRYTSLSWGQGWRDSSDFNEILHFFFDSILSTTLIPLLRRWLPSLFIQTGTEFATTSVQSTLLTSPASARTRLLPPTSLSICVVLRETVPWFPSSSLAMMGHINLRPRNTVSPSSCLYITCLQPSMVSLESQPSSYDSQVISARFELNDPSTNRATQPTITRHSRLSRSHGFGSTFPLGVIGCLRYQRHQLWSKNPGQIPVTPWLVWYTQTWDTFRPILWTFLEDGGPMMGW